MASHQGEHLAARSGMSGPITEVDHLIGQGIGSQLLRQRGHEGKAGSRHRPVVVEGHCKTRGTVRSCLHRKDAFLFEGCVDFSESPLPKTGGIFRVWSDLSGRGQGHQFGGSRFRGTIPRPTGSARRCRS